MVFLVRLAILSQRSRSVTGTAGLLDEVARVLTSIAPGGEGRVQVHGEIWTARSPEALEAGDRVRIVSVEGLTLTVRRALSREESPS
jgi:membrane-bound serine protease (ClpP class)